MQHSLDIKTLAYRRQFLLLNRNVPGLEGWNRDSFSVRDHKFNLYSHPDLDINRVKNDSFELVTLGYLLDPDHPGYSEKEILDELLTNRSMEDLMAGMEKYNGRFAVLLFNGSELRIFNDAVGFREVYYYLDDQTIAAGSTPNIIAEHLQIPKSEDKEVMEFYHSKEFAESQCTWMGTQTLYRDVLHLLPNHYLELLSGAIRRFWPAGKLEKMDLETCARECARILRGTIEAAVGRYRIHMGLTSGWDTRLLLAASREFSERIFYYVNRPASYPSGHKDLAIPGLLADKLGFELNIIPVPGDYDPEFEKVFFRNNVMARKLFLPLFYEVFRRGWQDTTTLSGTMGNGLARIYMRIPAGFEITGAHIARISNFHRMNYPVRELGIWADQIRESLPFWNVDIMDLFQMEQDNAHWAALSSSEQDIVREEIRPFNDRRLIRLFWSLEDRFRYQYYPRIYIRIIQLLWREVLDYPINPSRRTRYYRLLRIAGIEQSVYHYYKKRKFIKGGH